MSVLRTSPPRPAREVPAVVCSACRRGIRHDLCAGPPCVCLQCALRRTIAAARDHLAIPPGRPGRETLLAHDVRALLLLEDQCHAQRMKARTEVILAISRDVAVLEMGEYERGAGDIADLGGAGGDVLERPPAAGEQGEPALAQASKRPLERVIGA